MSTLFSCPHGHHWERLPGPSPVQTADMLCPVCGAPSLGDATSTDLTSPAQVSATFSEATAVGLTSRESAPSLLPNWPILSGYEVLGLLGQGGMGVVYKARHIALKRLVVLKMLLPAKYGEGHALARLRLEAEAMANLQHPNIVQIYEVGEHEQGPYFSMEFLEGGSLAARVSRGTVPPREAAALLELLAGAVHFAHQHGVLHRDLKPANVLLTADGVPKLCDFGLAKRLTQSTLTTQNELTSSGEVLGTPSFMAPEQAAGLGRDATPAVDVYSLGAVLYQMLTGEPPFHGKAPLETLLRVLHEEAAFPSTITPRLPRDLQTICLTCLQKDPVRRYASAEALADDLRRFLAGKPIQARPVSHWERLVLAVRRRPLTAALSGTAGVALLGLLIGAWFYSALAVSAVAVVSLLAGAWWYNTRLQAALRKLEQQHTRAERGLERLHLLLETTRRLMSARGLEELLQLLTETTARLADADRATIFLVDEDKKELWSKVALGDGVGEIRVPLGKGIAGTVAVSGETINLADPYADPRFNPEIDRRTGYRTHSMLTFPVRGRGGSILGVFQVLNKRGGPFTTEDTELLHSLAVSAGVAVEKSRSRPTDLGPEDTRDIL